MLQTIKLHMISHSSSRMRTEEQALSREDTKVNNLNLRLVLLTRDKVVLWVNSSKKDPQAFQYSNCKI